MVVDPRENLLYSLVQYNRRVCLLVWCVWLLALNCLYDLILTVVFMASRCRITYVLSLCLDSKSLERDRASKTICDTRVDIGLKRKQESQPLVSRIFLDLKLDGFFSKICPQTYQQYKASSHIMIFFT